jgi:hypothetical protein
MWEIRITFQERGTKKEVSKSVSFPTREAALVAVEKLEADIVAGKPTDFIIVDSGNRRISFLKQDFRRTDLYQDSGPIGFGSTA